MSERFNVSRSFFINWAKNGKVSIWFKRKNKIFRNLQVFDFALYPRSKAQKSQKFHLPRIMTLIVIQDLKAPKKSIATKTKRFQYDLEQKEKFRRLPSFLFCTIPKIENSEIPENSLLILNFDSLKSKRMCYGSIRKKLKLPRFPSFWFCRITKIKNSEI